MATKHDLLTLKEVAGILRVSRTTIYSYTRRRRTKGGSGFPFVKIGNSIRVPRAKFFAWAGLSEDN